MATLTPPRAETSSLLQNLDPEVLRRQFNRNPIRVSHDLPDNPLFDLDRLASLAEKLPSECVNWDSGDLPISIDGNHTPDRRRPVVDTIQTIDRSNAWVELKEIERDAEYRKLMETCLDEIEAISWTFAPGMTERQASIYIASPRSVAPFHIQSSAAFLLQVHGSMNLQLFDPWDREVLPEENLEELFTGGTGLLEYRESFGDRGSWFEVHASDGLHIPLAAPHWVQSGPQYSVAMSVMFQTQSSKQWQSIFRLNKRLRRLRLKPRPVGKNANGDAAKLLIMDGLDKLRNQFRMSGD